ncbi:MAG TPA: TRAP transporter small permease, partial [Alphaproteobacteria bacterium]|nr:TRAP transporter small permease [Alphaproteobacteria bacterium]
TVFAWGYLDMVEQLMALFAFVAVAYCERLGGHVRMELIISRLKGRSYWFVEALGILVGLIFIAIMIPPSFEHFMRAYELGDSTIDSGIPTWPSKLTVPVSFSLLWLRMFVELVGYIRLVIWPEAQPVAVPQLRDIEEQAAEEIRDTFGDEVASDGGRG